MNVKNIYFKTISNNIGRNCQPLKKCSSFRTVITTPHLSVTNYNKMEIANKKVNDFLFNYRKSRSGIKHSKKLFTTNLSNINSKYYDNYKDKEIKREIYYITKNIVSSNKINNNNLKRSKNRKFSLSSIGDLNTKASNNNIYDSQTLANKNFFTNTYKNKNHLIKKEDDKKEYYKFLYDMKRMKNNFASNTSRGNVDINY